MKIFARHSLAIAALACLAFVPAHATELSTLMSTQNADNVAITGGTISGVIIFGATYTSPTITGATIDNSVIGGTTPAAGTFTTEQSATLLGGGTTAANASLRSPTVASSVNQVVISGAATGSPPTIVTGGSGADTNANLSVAGNGTGIVLLGQGICTITGASPQICNGQRGIVTTGTLSTAAATDASYTVTDSSVTTSSLIVLTDEGYSGTLVTNGYPVLMSAVPGSGSFVVHITNTHASNALNGTVKIGFTVLN